jgi:hypothetical protein
VRDGRPVAIFETRTVAGRTFAATLAMSGRVEPATGAGVLVGAAALVVALAATSG